MSSELKSTFDPMKPPQELADLTEPAEDIELGTSIEIEETSVSRFDPMKPPQ